MQAQALQRRRKTMGLRLTAAGRRTLTKRNWVAAAVAAAAEEVVAVAIHRGCHLCHRESARSAVLVVVAVVATMMLCAWQGCDVADARTGMT
jgi:hypothetical protein